MNLNDCINIIKNCTMLACEYHIKDKCDYGYEVRENRFECAKERAIKALKKQIPQKVNDTRVFPNNTFGVCPSCGLHVIKTNYCQRRGQAFDWGE